MQTLPCSRSFQLFIPFTLAEFKFFTNCASFGNVLLSGFVSRNRNMQKSRSLCIAVFYFSTESTFCKNAIPLYSLFPFFISAECAVCKSCHPFRLSHYFLSTASKLFRTMIGLELLPFIQQNLISAESVIPLEMRFISDPSAESKFCKKMLSLWICHFCVFFLSTEIEF